jgi:hypothetical protein
LRRTSKDTDKTTTKQQRSQFAVVEDDKQLIVDNLAATSNTNSTMPAADIDNSPLTMTRTWEEVFGRLDQWDVVDKVRALHLKSSTSTSSTGFLQFKSPDIAHLVANTSRRVQLFHHFHHDVDDGLNDGTDELWALMGSGAMAAAMAVNKSHVNEPQRGTTFDWSKMLAWNSTRDVGDTVAEFAASRTQVSGRSSDLSFQPAPAKLTARAKSKAITTTKTQKAKGRLKTADDTEENEDKVTVVGFTMTHEHSAGTGFHCRGVHGDVQNGPLRTVLVGGTILTLV